MGRRTKNLVLNLVRMPPSRYSGDRWGIKGWFRQELIVCGRWLKDAFKLDSNAEKVRLTYAFYMLPGCKAVWLRRWGDELLWMESVDGVGKKMFDSLEQRLKAWLRKSGDLPVDGGTRKVFVQVKI